jgi:hypothetical protein
MGMETLNSAARAAGFAMAADDPLQDQMPDAKPDADPWRPGEAVLALPKVAGLRASRVGDWIRSIASLVLGRGAPA